MSLPEPTEPGKQLAVRLSEIINSKTSHLIGVLLTVAEASIADERQLSAFKSLLRRELYNNTRDYVQVLHHVVDRAEVKSFRAHPTLEEQLLDPPHDSYDFGDKI